MRTITIIFAGLCIFTATVFGALPTPDPDDGGITLPPGFRALVYADNLVAGKRVGRTQENLRGLAVAPNGDVYAKGLHGQIWALRDTNGDGRADVIQEFGPGVGGTHIMFHDGYLYHSSSTAVYRCKYIPGELVPSSPLEVIVHDLPQSGGHDQKAFAFDESGHMIVEVGSPFNDYSQPDRQFGAKGYSPEEVAKFQETYGGFWQFDANKTNQTQADSVRFATGIRHSLAVVWQPVSTNFFMCMMGRDQLNTVDPADYDALVLPGGQMNPDILRISKPAVSFVREFSLSGKPVAAICHGPVILIEAGVIKGRTVTSWPSIHTDLINAGAKWVDQEVVTDGNLITSRKPEDIPAFSRAIADALTHSSQHLAQAS